MSADMVEFDFEIVEEIPFQQMEDVLQQCKNENEDLDLELRAAMDRQHLDFMKIQRLKTENGARKNDMGNLRAELAKVEEESRRAGAELENQLKLREEETAQHKAGLERHNLELMMINQLAIENEDLDLQLRTAMDRQNLDLLEILRLEEENEDRENAIENLKAELAEVKEETRRVAAEIKSQLKLRKRRAEQEKVEEEEYMNKKSKITDDGWRGASSSAQEEAEKASTSNPAPENEEHNEVLTVNPSTTTKRRATNYTKEYMKRGVIELTLTFYITMSIFIISFYAFEFFFDSPQTPRYVTKEEYIAFARKRGIIF